jgi:N-formylglutamate deformylase
MLDTKPFLISIPHSGEQVPPEVAWLQGLPEPLLMCDVDRFVDRLYQPTFTQLPIPHVKTEWHRYVVDLNRLPEDVDADSVIGSANPSGKFPMGLHWVKTTRGSRLMPQPITPQAHQQLVARYFQPFHDQVLKLYADLRAKGAKKVYHLDAHSMPSMGTSAHADPGQKRAEIVISDCKGKSCEPAFKDLVIESYEKAGLKTAYNWPYVGGRVTQTYGLPDQGQHAIQVEINRSLYMDEESKKWIPEKANELSRKLHLAVQRIYQQLPAI